MEESFGVGSWSSLGTFRSEFNVDDLPRKPNLDRVGEDLLLDAVEPCLNSGTAGAAKELEALARAMAGNVLGDGGACDTSSVDGECNVAGPLEPPRCLTEELADGRGLAG